MEIIMPAYNCVETLGAALDSLVCQTNQNFTVLIVDDCSSQDIYSIIQSYQDKLNIRYIRNEKNVGCGMTRQRGIDETTADYIAFLDADDQLLPDAVDVWLKEIDTNHPDAIYSPWIRDMGFLTLTKFAGPLGMCHGKVYNVDFLRKYDIQESPEIRCKDDYYLNIQVFCLAKNVSVLDTYTYIYLDNAKSVTKQLWFLERHGYEEKVTEGMALSQVARFKETTIEPYRALEAKICRDVFKI
jgi:glycosyltransferase involved in cell wall biosynthesis